MRVADRSFNSAIGAAIIFALMWSMSWSLPLRAETADVQQSFAMDLVAAARQQRAVLAIYDPSYRQLDYPIWCGPAMGAFNDWVKGSYLESYPNRQVSDVAEQIMQGAAYLYRMQALKMQGVTFPSVWERFEPVRGNVAANAS